MSLETSKSLYVVASGRIYGFLFSELITFSRCLAFCAVIYSLPEKLVVYAVPFVWLTADEEIVPSCCREAFYDESWLMLV